MNRKWGSAIRKQSPKLPQEVQIWRKCARARKIGDISATGLPSASCLFRL